MAELYDTFHLYDKDDNCSITKEELTSVLYNLGQFPSQLEINEMLLDIGIDGAHLRVISKDFGARTKHQWQR